MKACGWIHDPLPYLQWSHIVFAGGRALREAMACGNVGFLIAQGYGGMVQKNWFEKGNQHRNHLREAKNVARRIAEDNFEIKKIIEQTYAIYQKAIEDYTSKKRIRINRLERKTIPVELIFISLAGIFNYFY